MLADYRALARDLYGGDDPDFAPDEYLEEEQEILRSRPLEIADRIDYWTFHDAVEVHRPEWGDGRTDLFIEAIDCEKSDLLRLIRANLFSHGEHYLYLAPADGGHRNNFDAFHSSRVARGDADIAEFAVFAGPFRYCPVGMRAMASPPSARPVNIGFLVHTIEFDTVGLGRQLHFARRIGKIDRRLREFCDYRGHAVVYSGGKSPHYHFLSDLHHLRHIPHAARHGKFSGEMPEEYLPELHRRAWARLSEIFRAELDAGDAKPDASLASLAQPRRLPLGHRRVGKNHPLGFPEGAHVRQVVLAEKIAKTAPRGADKWLHDPAALNECRDALQAERAQQPMLSADAWDAVRAARSIEAGFTPAQIQAGMAVADIDQKRTRIRNSRRDSNPGSVFLGDFKTIRTIGTDATAALHDNGVGFSEQMRVNARMASAIPFDGDELNREFRARVSDPHQVYPFLAERIAVPLLLSGVTAIVTAEGAGKTHAAMKSADTLIANAPLADANGKRWVIFACPEYQQLHQKIAEFRRIWGEDIIAFEMRSVTRLYEDAIEELQRDGHDDIKAANEQQALESGRAWLRYVCEEQPEVWRLMRRTPERLWRLIREGRKIVLFAVHEVARRHILSGVSRLFYSPELEAEFFSLHGGERERDVRQRQRRTAAAQVVFDEISVTDLLAVRPQHHVEWAQRFLAYAQALAAHRRKRFDEMAAHEQYAIGKRFVASDPRPEDIKEWWWQALRDLIAIPFGEDDLVTIERVETLKTGGEKDGNIYRDVIGRKSYVRPATWIDGVTEKVTILTTELLAGLTVKRLQALGHDARTLWFDDPARLRQDHCHVIQRKDCRKANVRRIVDEFRNRHPTAKVIADTIGDPNEASTHAGARGSNDWSDRSLVAIFLYPAPAHFADLTAIGHWLDIDIPAALAFLDRFNQTVGRNRGLRCQSGTETFVVMSRALSQWLLPYLRYAGRYCTPISNEKSR